MQYNHSGDQFVILDFLFSTDGRNLNVSEEKKKNTHMMGTFFCG